MHDEPLPRKLNERSGKHLCTRCLAETPAEEYFANDHVCDKCAEVIAAELDGEKTADE
ncbi:MAG: hypothetical protein AABO58_05280 [Acidobacteriota bacterium]